MHADTFFESMWAGPCRTVPWTRIRTRSWLSSKRNSTFEPELEAELEVEPELEAEVEAEREDGLEVVLEVELEVELEVGVARENPTKPISESSKSNSKLHKITSGTPEKQFWSPL